MSDAWSDSMTRYVYTRMSLVVKDVFAVRHFPYRLRLEKKLDGILRGELGDIWKKVKLKHTHTWYEGLMLVLLKLRLYEMAVWLVFLLYPVTLIFNGFRTLWKKCNG